MLNIFTFDVFSVCHSLSQSVTGIVKFTYLAFTSGIWLFTFFLIQNICLAFYVTYYYHSFCVKYRICNSTKYVFVSCCKLCYHFPVFLYLNLLVWFSIHFSVSLITSVLWTGCPCLSVIHSTAIAERVLCDVWTTTEFTIQSKTTGKILFDQIIQTTGLR